MNRQKCLAKLKKACLITMVLGIILFFVVAPMVVARDIPEAIERYGPRFWIDLGYIWIVGALCFRALAEAWKVCVQIGEDNTFSLQNAVSLRLISRLMAVACAMMAVGFVVYLAINKRNPNLWMLGLIALGVCIALIFSLFASALAELIRYGARIKQENDLTI